MAQISYSQDIVEILKDNKSSFGISLYDHIQTLFRKLNQEQQDDFYNFDNIEVISNMLKQSQFIYNDIKTDQELAKGFNKHENIWVNECLQLLHPKYGQKVTVGSVQNFQQDAKMLEWAGICFGETETYWIQKSLQKLAIDSQASYIRFWGKILAKGKDYYVCEGKINKTDNIKLDRNYESENTGVNTFTYWVTDCAINEWTKLPQISSEQLRVSRLIQPILEGDLDAKVHTFPKFPGQEKHLLKAIIVRISFGSLICPKGLYRPNEENGKQNNLIANEIEFEEEFKMPEMADLNNIETWVHQNANILKSGRINHLEPVGVTDEEKEAIMADLGEKDPVIERLKAIAEDKPMEGFETNWLLRTVGDSQVYQQLLEEAGAQSYNYLSIKSLVWPGSITISSAKRYLSLYVGYGHKQGVNSFNPTSPENVNQDPEDNDEQPEPNPKEQVYQVEPDSDDENKKNEEEEEA